MRNEIKEAAAIVERAVDLLLRTSGEKQGRTGSDLRRACGDVKAHAESLIYNNKIAVPLANCFYQTLLCGATLSEFDQVRRSVLAETPVALIAVLMKQACVTLCLKNQSLVIAKTKFVSRDDVENVQTQMNDAFAPAEEIAADEMASPTYIALIRLHAAVTFHLCNTARPLPRMLRFEFAAPRPTLVFSYRLYDTAARADQLRVENKVIHPAFMDRSGRALSG
jgi:hypothetical protein